MADLQPRDASTDEESSTEKPKKKQSRRKQRRASLESPPSEIVLPNAIEAITVSLSTTLISMPGPIRLLVCSIGNPGAYISTLHSAGHTVLSTLASSLGYPSFQKSRVHGNGLLSAGEEFTLWQSSSMMNTSGPAVAAAWKQFCKDNGTADTRLAVLHDELELGLGQVKVKKGEASPKGHNGLKSIKEVIRGEWTRIGVGIGRPESRDQAVVSTFVLRNMSPVERGKVEGSAGRVLEELRRLSG